MALFDVFLREKSIKVLKVDKAQSGSIKGFIYVETLTSSTKLLAQKQAESKISSGFYTKKQAESKLSSCVFNNTKKAIDLNNVDTSKILPTINSHPIKKAIYCDFNGVIDDRELDKTVNQNESDHFRLPKIACPHKVYKLAKLAIDTNSSIIITSLFRLYGIDFYYIISRCLSNCNIPEYVTYFKDNEDLIYDLTMTCPTSDLNNRSDEIRKHIIRDQYTHFVVFEDSHHIDKDLNPIMTEWSVGLLDCHVEKAYSILMN